MKITLAEFKKWYEVYQDLTGEAVAAEDSGDDLAVEQAEQEILSFELSFLRKFGFKISSPKSELLYIAANEKSFRKILGGLR